jgi:pimeloyl-ACP methyl ester carboxylesterase
LPPAPPPGSEHLVVRRGDHEIGVTRWPGDGPPLVLTHGAGLGADVFAPVGPRLARHWDVSAVDLRGHGRSGGSGDHEIAPHTADLLVVIEELDLADIHVFGHSFGGLIALQAAVEAPDHFTRVAAFEPAIPHPDETPDAAAQRLEQNTGWILARDAWWPDVGALRRHFSTVRAYSELGGEFVEALIDHGTVAVDGGIRLRSGPEIEAELFRVAVAQSGGVGHRDRLSTLGTGAVPIALVCGDGSSFRLDMYRRVADRAGIELDVIHGGHFAPFQSADRLVALIEEHLHDH